jgi:hypothetical protein
MVLLSMSLFDFCLQWLPITVDKADKEEGNEDLAMQLYMIELIGVMHHYSCECSGSTLLIKKIWPLMYV